MNTWMTSDNHFFHKNIKRFCPETRQGDTVEEMNELMIQKWNQDVKPLDLVYCMGDFSFGWEDNTEKVLRRLNGIKVLVLGNHEKYLRKLPECNPDGNRYFIDIQDYIFTKIDDHEVVMFHYPIWEWRNMHRGSFHLYGHVHGGVQIPGRAMDVGIDTRPNKDMTLWPWEEVKETLLKREIRSHHDRDGQ